MAADANLRASHKGTRPCRSAEGEGLGDTRRVARMLDVLSAAVHEGVTRPSLPHRLTAAQWGALRYLALHHISSLGAAAQALDISPSAASRLFDRLVRRGWVTRRIADGDRRRVELELTPEGHRLVDRVIRLREERYARILRAMPHDARRALLAGTRTFISAATGVEDLPEDACLRCGARGETVCPAVLAALREG